MVYREEDGVPPPSANGWYRGTAATANGNSLYISADSGATHSSTPVHGYLWAMRELQFASAGDYRINYDWIANGLQNSNYVFEYLRFFLVPHGVLFDTNYFANTFANSSNKNTLPAGWISLSDNGNDLYLRGETIWQHHSQPFHLDNGGTYALVVLWANHDPYMYSGPSYKSRSRSLFLSVLPLVKGYWLRNLLLNNCEKGRVSDITYVETEEGGVLLVPGNILSTNSLFHLPTIQ